MTIEAEIAILNKLILLFEESMIRQMGSHSFKIAKALHAYPEVPALSREFTVTLAEYLEMLWADRGQL